jgi:hypothetical protein
MPQPSKSRLLPLSGHSKEMPVWPLFPTMSSGRAGDLAALDRAGGEGASVLAACGRRKRVAGLADYRMLRCGTQIETRRRHAKSSAVLVFNFTKKEMLTS